MARPNWLLCSGQHAQHKARPIDCLRRVTAAKEQIQAEDSPQKVNIGEKVNQCAGSAADCLRAPFKKRTSKMETTNKLPNGHLFVLV